MTSKEALSHGLNGDAVRGGRHKKLKGKITQIGVDAFNNDLMQEIWKNEIEETLYNAKSSKYHIKDFLQIKPEEES